MSDARAPEEIVQAIADASDEDEARRVEAEALEATENGWHEGDPEEQPEQVNHDGQRVV